MSGHVREQLSALLDGELGAAERGAVVAHLASCRECSAFLEGLAGVDQELARLPLPETEDDEGFAARVRARIEKEARPRGAARRPWSPRVLPAWTWAAAAALLLAVVAPLTLHEVRAPSVEKGAGAMAAAKQARADRERQREEGAPVPEQLTAATRPARRAPPPREAATAPAPRAPAPAAPAAAPGLAGADQKAEAKAPPPASGEAAPSPVELQGPTGFAVAPQRGQPSGEAPTLQGGYAKSSAPRALERRAKTTTRDALENEATSAARLEEAPRTLEEWRRLRDAWRERVRADPEGPGADEARLREIEAAAQACRAGGDEEDARVLKHDVAEYLARAHAPEQDRVRRLLREALP